MVEGAKKRPDGIAVIALLLALTSILAMNQAVQTLMWELPFLPDLPDLFDPSAAVWQDYTMAEREWISFALPVEIVLGFSVIALGLLTIFTAYGLFAGKSWSYKPAFTISVFNAIAYGAAAALYASAPAELFFDPEFSFYLTLTPISLAWIVVTFVYLRRPNVKQFIVGSLPPPTLPISALHVGTKKGDVIEAIASQGRPLKWTEIRELTGLDEKSLNYALYELISSKEVRKVGAKYEVSEELHADYHRLFNRRRNELISWIAQWKKVRKLGFSLEHGHFFLEGRHLDDFSKELIAHAKSEVLVVNPFIQDCDLSNTLREARKNGINVQIITRPLHDRYPERLKMKQEYHSKLKQDGISLFYEKRVHAKLLVVDRAVAIASSMNFYPDSSAGVSWEAGLISTDASVVESIVQSALARLA